MEKFYFKFNKWLVTLCSSIVALSAFVVLRSIIKLFNASLAVDYFSAIFLIAFNLVIIVSVIKYVLTSSYSLDDSKLIIKTAYFKDPVSYKDIKKILYYVNEEELYLQLMDNVEADYLRIHIKNNDFTKFVNALKKHIPDTPYEISLSLESEE